MHNTKDNTNLAGLQNIQEKRDQREEYFRGSISRRVEILLGLEMQLSGRKVI